MSFALTNSLSLSRQTCRCLPNICQVFVAAQQPKPQIRNASYHCDEEEEAKSATTKSLQEEPWNPHDKVYRWESVWEHPPCCDPDCDIIRHDVLFLKPQPKKYTRTWVECREIEKMAWDCSGEIEPPEILPRAPPTCKEEASRARCKMCPGDESNLGLMKCKPMPPMGGPCVKRRMPCCKPVRDPPVCSKVVIHSCCQKRCTQYPSFSECNRDRPPLPRPIECKCLKIPSMCEVYAQFRKFGIK